jgi:SAM-dependent methyltransferase
MFEIRITERVHQLIHPYIQAGDVVIDATMGNGNDTLFLAESVGSHGLVFSFDIQKQAIEVTRNKLIKNQYEKPFLIHKDDRFEKTPSEEGVYLMNHSHENIDFIPIEHFAKEQKISCILFNFGYLPGGDKTITSHSHVSLEAIKKSLRLVKEKGIVSLVTYPGHAEGQIEDLAIEHLLSGLSSKCFEILKISYVNRSQKAPKQYLIYKKRCQTTDNVL